MSALGLRPDQLGPNDVANAVGHEYGSGHEALLRMARDIRHSNGDDEADCPAKESRDGISHNGQGGVMAPGAFPDHGATSNNGQAGKNEHEDTNIAKLGAKVACR